MALEDSIDYQLTPASQAAGMSTDIWSAKDPAHGGLYYEAANLVGIQVQQNYASIAWVPNDPLYSSNQWDMPAIGMPAAWDYNRGGRSDVKVAVIDTGLTLASDLATLNVDWADAWNFASGTSSVTDGHGHGTHVTGTVAGNANNGLGVAGIAFNTTILPLKALDDSGSGSDLWVANAINQAVSAGADIISMSLGGGASSLIQAACLNAYNNGVFVVAAAGNSGLPSLDYPGGYSTVLAVGSTTSSNALSSFSNHVANMVVAPGSGITQQLPDGSYGTWSGTSMATPHVAGEVALLLAEVKDLGLAIPVKSAARVDWIRSKITANTLDLGTAGQDSTFGYGEIRVDQLLASIQTGNPPSGDDYSANTNTNGYVTVGGTATGSLETVGDRDWFRVDLTAGYSYRFDLEGSATSQGTLANPYLYFYNSSGSLLGQADNGGTGANSRLTYAATTGGAFYLGAGASGDNATGTYRFSVSVMDDYAGDATTTGVLPVGGRVTGAIETTGDRDWFRATLTAGSQYVFDLEGSPSNQGTLSDTYLYLYNAAGSLLVSDDDTGVGYNSQITYRATASGSFFLGAGAYGDRLTGSYRLSAALNDDYADDASTPTSLALGGSLTGNIERNADRDWQRVTLQAGNSYQFDLQGSPSGQGSLSNPYLYLYNSSGTQVASADNGGSGLDARLTYLATASGTYYISAAASGDNLTGTYRLSLSYADDYAGGTSTAGTLALGGSQTGNITFLGDRDWFKLAMTSGRQYVIDLEGAASSAGTLTDPYLYLYNSAGTLLTSVDNGGSGANSRLTYTAAATGNYFLGAGSAGDLGTGSYKLSARVVDDYAGDASTSGTLAVGATVQGDLETGTDKDWVKINLLAGSTYNMSIQGSTARVPLALSGPALTLYNASGSQVAVASLSGGVASLTYTAASSGSYYLGAAAAVTGLTANLAVSGAQGISDSVIGNVASYSAAQPFDGNESTFWASNTPGSGLSGVAWIGYDFGAGNAKEIDRFRILNYGASAAPSSIRLQSSANGSAWSDQGTYAMAQNNLWQSFDVAGETAARYWRVLANSSTVNYWCVNELQFMAPVRADAGGGYQISASVRDDYSADTSTIGSLSVPTDTTVVRIQGAVETAGDRDWVRVSMSLGNAYHFDLAGTGTGALADPCLYLYNSSGTLLTSNDNYGGSANSHIDWTPASTGNYYLGVGASGDAGTGTYTLSGWDPPIATTDSGLSPATQATLSQVAAAGTQALQEILAASSSTAGAATGSDPSLGATGTATLAPTATTATSSGASTGLAGPTTSPTASSTTTTTSASTPVASAPTTSTATATPTTATAPAPTTASSTPSQTSLASAMAAGSQATTPALVPSSSSTSGSSLATHS